MSQKPVNFEGLKPLYFYESLGFRNPKKGEFYLSGAIPMGYMAKNDMSSPYHIIRPTYKANPRIVTLIQGYEKGDKI